MSFRIALALVAVLVATGCDLPLPPAGTDGGPDGEWRLVGGVHGGDRLRIPADAPITMTIERAEVGGRAACNTYGGELTLDGDRIGFGAMSMTEMGCDPAIMQAESAYLAALNEVERWDRQGENLTLAGEAVELTYELIPPTPDAPLVGTTWRLDGLVDGEAVSSTMGDPATLLLGDDGRLTGTTGCRTFEGRHEVEGGTVRVTDLTNDDRACPGLETQDEHVLAVIGGGFAAMIDGDRLTLSDGRLGLLYLADG